MWIEIDQGPGVHPVFCRDLGTGTAPLLHLHGGWGYEIYPFDQPLSILGSSYRVLIPDRTGYGRSGRRCEAFGLDFHRQAAAETLRVMDGLELETSVVWGHSDGACTAVWMGLDAPERCRAIILEALHFDRAKPSSRTFFETMATEPGALGKRVASVLAREHGADYWQDLLALGGNAWLTIRDTSWPHPDLFNGRLGELEVPVLILHGEQDPRTEPDEMAMVLQALPRATTHMIEAGGHCPHSEPEVWREATNAAIEFLDSLDRD